jgi:hypothetical protein
MIGDVLTIEDQDGVSAIVVLSGGTYRVIFAENWRTAESYTWSGSAIGTTLIEVERTASTLTVQTTNLGNPARWGIHAIGHCGGGESGSGDSGDSGDSGSGGSGSGSGGVFGPGGDPDCETAVSAPHSLGVTYGPYSITDGAITFEEQWYAFPLSGTPTMYHLTITWSGGTGGVGGSAFQGSCAALTGWFGTANGTDVAPVSCAQGTSDTGIMVALVKVTGSTGNPNYTIVFDEGPCS